VVVRDFDLVGMAAPPIKTDSVAIVKSQELRVESRIGRRSGERGVAARCCRTRASAGRKRPHPALSRSSIM
jgi:hypothetical protein